MRALLLALAASLLLPLALAQVTEENADVMIHAVDQNAEYAFLPNDAEVPPGGTVLVMTFGQEPHAMRAVDGSFDTDAIQPNAQTSFAAPTTPGEYRYYCPYHATKDTLPSEGMAGILRVVETTSATPTPASPTPTPAAKNDTPLGIVAVLAGVALAVLVAQRRR